MKDDEAHFKDGDAWYEEQVFDLGYYVFSSSEDGWGKGGRKEGES